MASDLQQLKILLQVRDREFARALNKNTARINRFSKQSNRSLSRTTQGFNMMAMSMRGLLPALGATVLIAKTKRVVAELDEIGKTADNIGLTTDALQELRVIAESSGLTFQEFTKGFTKFSVNVGEASTGIGEAVDAFERLGVSLFDTEGRLKSAEQVFNEVADGMAGFENDSERASVAADLFGQRVGIKMLNMLQNGSDGMAKMRKAARDLGVVIEEDVIRKSEAAQTELDLLSRRMNAQVSTALVNLIPLLLSVGKALVWITTKAGEAAAGLRLIGSGFEIPEGLRDPSDAIFNEYIAASAAVRDLEDSISGMQDMADQGAISGGDFQRLNETTEAIKMQRAAAEELWTAYQALRETENTPPPPPPPPPDVLDEGFGFSAAKRIQALSQELELLGMTTDAQKLKRIEISATAMEIDLMNEAMATNNSISAEEQAVITGLVAAFERESLALLESTAAQQGMTGARGADVEAIEEQVDALDELEQANQRLVEDFIDALTGAENLKEGLNDLLKMFVKLAATSFLQGLFGVAPKDQSGLGAFFSDLGGGLNGRASGGAVQSGSAYMVGESGPEPFVPAQNGRVLSVAQAQGAIGGGGGISQEININISTGVQSTVRAEIISMMPQIAEVAKSAVLDANQRGGHFRKSLQGG